MLKIKLDKYKDAFNTYDQDVISESLENYINSVVKMIPLNDVKINIEGKFEEEEKDKLILAIHKTYEKKNDYLDYIDKHDHIFRLVLFLIGVILILLSYILKNIFREISLIAGWVIIWEVIYDLLFNSVKRKRKKHLYKELSNCQITFKKENKNE